MIQKVSEVLVLQPPRIALLNEPIEHLPHSKQRLLFFMLLAAKRSIARSWKKASVSMSLFRRKVFWIMLNEEIAGVINVTAKRFETIWSPWADYVHVKLYET